uniref:Uncharacterized protein n=1 Tax=Oryza barthii TaxID=65489 RepID=A0A0D3HLI2_9ORYZ
MAKCRTHTHQGVMLFCLVLLMCSAIPAQITGQTTYKIRRDMLIGVKNKISFGELYYKPDHCVRTRGGFYCCELGQLCYPTLELCIPACTPSKRILLSCSNATLYSVDSTRYPGDAAIVRYRTY